MRICIAAALGASLALPADETAPQPPYTPAVEPASDEAALALHGIQIPDGLRVELFAAEPMLANPVAFSIDEQGRCFVAETFRMKNGVTDTREHMVWLDDDLAARTVADRVAMYRKYLGDISESYTAQHERVRLIEDLDGDGKADRSRVFADSFHDIADGVGAGLLARRGDVWYTCIPRLWLLRDEDNDGRAEVQKPLHDGYGVHVAYLGHDLHGLRFGPDGRLYFSLGDRGLNFEHEGKRFFHPDTGVVLRCEPDGSKLEIFATGLRNPQELAFNELGDLFTGENNSDGGDRARWVHLVEGGDCGWRLGYQFIERPVSRGPWNAERLWAPRWEGQAAYIIPPIENIADGPAGLTFYPGTGLPPRYDGHFFLCDFRGVSGSSGVRSFGLERQGASYKLVDAHQFAWSVLATDCDFGPDSALYISDWVAGWDKTGKGRIYKVSHPVLSTQQKTKDVQELLAMGMERRSSAELTQLLAHADQRIRQEAQFALAAKGLSAIPALFGVARSSTSTLARVHAVWAIGQVARRDAPALEPLVAILDQSDGEVRAQAAKVLGDAAADLAHDRFVDLLADAEPRVRFFAAIGLAKVARKEDLPAILELLRANADQDHYVRHAAVMALAGARDANALGSAAKDRDEAVRLGILLALRRLESPGVAVFLGDSSDRLVLEAARAIHDVPIDAALPLLADLPLKPGAPDPLVARVLNASFRIGSQEGSDRIAAAAARDDLSDGLRVEALEELAAWPRPSGRDRVMGLWRPLAPRPAEPSTTSLRKILPGILAGAPEPVRVAAVKATAQLQMKDTGDALARALQGQDGTGRFRREALAALESLGDARLLELSRKALVDPGAVVRSEGLRILTRLRPADAVPALEAALERGATPERQEALASLGGLKDPKAAAVLSKWMDRLLEGSAPAEIQLDLLEAAAAQGSPELRSKLEKHEASRRADDPVAAYGETLEGGDATHGKEIFYEKKEVSCLRCHKSDGEGGEVGPSLADVGKRESREHILESLVAPNRKIAKGFDTVVLVTHEGKIYTGVLKDEDDKQVRFRLPEGPLIAVDKADIAQRSGGVSAMPEDVIQHLTRREIRDLLAYLTKLGSAPLFKS